MLSKLLHWGDAALEKSVNQPSLPHAVVCLNATDMGIDPSGWDPQRSTAQLLATVNTALDDIRGIPDIKELAAKWEDRGVKIRNVLGLIRKYYASFTVIQIPIKGRYTLMDEQVSKVEQAIRYYAAESHRSKRRARMLSNADDLNIYLQAAFDHFTRNLDEPFNFIEVSLRNNPLPENFGDHILQLAIAIQAHHDQRTTSGPWIFEHLGQMVASCILQDCVQNRKGGNQDKIPCSPYLMSSRQTG